MAPAGDKGTWTQRSDMPDGKYGMTANAVNGKIYIIGGVDLAGLDPFVQEYNPTTDTWTKKADMPAARAFLSTSLVNGKIYPIGGKWQGKNVEVYDPVTDTWTVKPDAPTVVKHDYAASVVDGRLYAFGGMLQLNPLILSDTLEEYTPEGWQFSVTPRGKLPTKWGDVRSD